MPMSNALPKIIAGLLLLLVPGTIGWSAGFGGRGRRLVRVLAGLALLAAVIGMLGVVLDYKYASSYVSPPGNDFAYGRAANLIIGVALLAAAILLAIVACAAALAQTRAERRRQWLRILLLASATPLVLSVTFFTLDLLRVESRGIFFPVSGYLGAFATLGIAAYAIFGLASRRPREIARSS
ncbi:MAG TPA: hypothetical protein VJN88_00870 [Ktedonobacterales bacterium]|nr:hypothetical protein [Ktedonobacterales bacterium]